MGRLRVLGLTLGLCMLMNAAQAELDLATMLAKLTPPEGWAFSGEATSYNKDTVFNLIDGEAELYFPYGFTGVVAADYARKDNPKTVITAEVYEMGSLLDAFGIYSNFRDAGVEIAPLGAEGFVDPMQITFYQDRYFAKIRLSGKPDENPGALLACARAIAKALPPNTAKPAELDLLKVEGIAPQSEQYVAQSVLGYAFFAKGFTAQTPLGGKPARVFLVIDASPEAAAQTLKKYEEYLTTSKAEFQWRDLDGKKTLLARDPLHKGLALRQVKSYVLGIARIAAPEDAVPLLDKIEEHIAGLQSVAEKATCSKDK